MPAASWGKKKKKLNGKAKRKYLGGTYVVSIHDTLRYNCKVQISSKGFNDCAFEGIARLKSSKEFTQIQVIFE